MSHPDEDPKKSSVPSWQTSEKGSRSNDLKSEQPDVNTTQSPSTPSRESILEQAKKFLEEDEVRDASTDKKVAFLESKGLKGDEIEALLGVRRNEDASSTRISTTPVTTPENTTIKQSPPPTQTPYTPSSISQPPIITYPEFLTKPAAPAPLVTKPRLLTTLYTFSALTFLLYGASTYLTTPMLESLTSSRLELASTARENLLKLLSKLESMVSELPATVGLPGHKTSNSNGKEQVEESEDEDPTELFHRDIGVQTSLPSTPSPASASPSLTPVDEQSNRLSSLKASLEGVIEDSTSEGYDLQELEATIGVLREYCDGLAYVSPVSNYGSYGYSVAREEKDDEIARVKAGIRGVKGVLLSARSFPGGVRAGVR